MLSHVEKLLKTFVQVNDTKRMDTPQWLRYQHDFLSYFKLFKQANEFTQFNNIIFYPCLEDRTPSTPVDKYYFYQDTWASRKIFERQPKSVVDIGSTVLYVGIISQFVPTTFVDIRPVEFNLPNLTVINASVLNLPFADASQTFITSLRVLEHIGLGRYGDPIMPDGTQKACAEIDRVLQANGELILSVNLGIAPCIAFNAHRIFSKEQFLSYFPNYTILDEIYLSPEPTNDPTVINTLDIGEFVVWVVHLKKHDGEVYDFSEITQSVPPPHKYKQQVVKTMAQKFSINIFVETGTYLGEMILAVKDMFNYVYSIELSCDLWNRAKNLFSQYPHIKILKGDSGELLPKLIVEISQPCLFWLDGHYSGGLTAKGKLETPIIQELTAIFQHPYKDKHVILIDDARCFTGKNDYPTINGLYDLVKTNLPNHKFKIYNDIIRIYPNPDF